MALLAYSALYGEFPELTWEGLIRLIADGELDPEDFEVFITDDTGWRK